MRALLAMDDLNHLNREQWEARLGWLFEGTPWIVAQAWDQRPFLNREVLWRCLCGIMEGMTQEGQVALIRAHPDLAGRLALEGQLSAPSTTEQRSAGLVDLNQSEVAMFIDLNQRYRERFGFPFVICAREHTKESILGAFRERLSHERDHEIRRALKEIARIVQLRLEDVIQA
ncbi:MAG: 2-oxo-4-hydroxy-4-carboxy-5-ureidoimidazoline decarboxylase [Herpetosiphon sp.]